VALPTLAERERDDGAKYSFFEVEPINKRVISYSKLLALFSAQINSVIGRSSGRAYNPLPVLSGFHRSSGETKA